MCGKEMLKNVYIEHPVEPNPGGNYYTHFQKPLVPPAEHVGSQKHWSAFLF
jgi:hypothetical protein